MNKKAMIAMSGGVDSSVAAALLVHEGWDCIGAMMKLRDDNASENGCGTISDAAEAQKVADKLGIPFNIFNFVNKFSDCVIDNFVSSYERGLTPNPCIVCNKHLKFGALLDAAKELGCDKIATGHYAQIEYDKSIKRWVLKKSVNSEKDQSYVLYSLTQEQLSHILFPLGAFNSKDEIRSIARNEGFENASKHESQDICFIPDKDYAGYISKRTKKIYKTGNFVDETGRILGKNKGIIHYTIGQRKGLGLSLPAPLYVCRKDVLTSDILLTPEDRIFSDTLIADDFNWVSIEKPDKPIRVTAKTRYRAKEAPAVAEVLTDGKVKVTFDEPQRAITPGQAVVLYDGMKLVGGGTITE